MSTVQRILSSIKRVIVMESKLQGLSDGLSDVTRTVLDHEKRLVRLETVVEIAKTQSRLPSPDQ